MSLHLHDRVNQLDENLKSYHKKRSDDIQTVLDKMEKIKMVLNMNSDQYKDSKRILPDLFEFDEDFDPECFEETHEQRNPTSLTTKSSKLLNDKKEVIKSDIAEVFKRHRLNFDINDDKDLNNLIDRLLVANSNDPEVRIFLQKDKSEVAVQTDP